MKRTFSESFYRGDFPVDEFIRLLIINNEVNKSIILGILNSGHNVVFSFASVITKKTHGDNFDDFHKIKDLIISPDIDHFGGETTIDYVFSQLKQKFCYDILSQQDLCEIHLYGFSLHNQFFSILKTPLLNSASEYNKSSSSQTKYSEYLRTRVPVKQRNFVVDMDLSPNSLHWDLVGRIDKERVKARSLQTSLGETTKTYSTLVMLQMAHFSSLMLTSLKMNDKFFLLPNHCETSSTNNTNNPTFDNSICLLSKSISEGRKSPDDALNIYFSGSKGIHVWFDQTSVDTVALKAFLKDCTNNVSVLIENTKDTIEWIDNSVIIESGKIFFPARIERFITLIYQFTTTLDLERYTNKVYSQEELKEILQRKDLENLNQTMGVNEICMTLFRLFYCHVFDIKAEKKMQMPDRTSGKFTLNTFIDTLILHNIWNRAESKTKTKKGHQEKDVIYLRKTSKIIDAVEVHRVILLKIITIGLLLFDPLMVMDFGIYQTNHSIKIPYSMNGKTHLTSFKISDWRSMESITKGIENEITDAYTYQERITKDSKDNMEHISWNNYVRKYDESHQ